jgi:hypothetical protein
VGLGVQFVGTCVNCNPRCSRIEGGWGSVRFAKDFTLACVSLILDCRLTLVIPPCISDFIKAVVCRDLWAFGPSLGAGFCMGAGACCRHRPRQETPEWLLVEAEGAENPEAERGPTGRGRTGVTGLTGWQRLLGILLRLKFLRRLWASLGHHLNYNFGGATRLLRGSGESRPNRR